MREEPQDVIVIGGVGPTSGGTLRRALVLWLVLAGVLPSIALTQADSALPAPKAYGGKIDVGGFQLAFGCLGEGSPTVILEAGFGDPGVRSWVPVQRLAARVTRVCHYSRAGRGQSDPPPGDGLRSGREAVRELRVLLDEAEIDGPYVLVGHSFGGYLVRLFAAEYSADVVGMVLVDASHEDQIVRQEAFMSPRLRAFRDSLFAAPAEPIDFVATAAEVVEYAPTLNDLPLVVITAGQLDPPPAGLDDSLRADMARSTREFRSEWLAFQDGLAQLSTDSQHIMAERSGHYIQATEPELIVFAIVQLVERARQAETAR